MTMDTDPGIPVNIRCSAVVYRGDTVLLVHRSGGGRDDWVLPGGTPRLAESVASCARREVDEEAGLQVVIDRVAFVLESRGSEPADHLIDLVFTVTESDGRKTPRASEPGLSPEFVPLDRAVSLPVRPPIVGHLRALHGRGGRGEGAYLGNLWRPGRDDLQPEDV